MDPYKGSMKKQIQRFALGFMILLCAACAPNSESGRSKAKSAKLRPSVYVVNTPLHYFAQRIGGENMDIVFPAPPEVDPAFWEPGVETITQYQQADLILRNGAGYAKWMEWASLPASATIDTSLTFKNRYLPADETTTHRHGPDAKHVHGGTAFTTWLDPTLAIEQARAIQQAFALRWPRFSAKFRQRFVALERDLLELDARIEKNLAPHREEPLIFSHPVYQYFIRCYNLNAKSVHWEPDEFPDEKQWAELEKQLKTHPAHWMVWEGTPLESTVQKLKTLGVESTVFAPGANLPDPEAYLNVMKQNAEELFSEKTGSF